VGFLLLIDLATLATVHQSAAAKFVFGPQIRAGLSMFLVGFLPSSSHASCFAITQKRQPELMGASVFGLDDIHSSLSKFALRHRGSVRHSVFPQSVSEAHLVGFFI
jgi:hypothetical protein